MLEDLVVGQDARVDAGDDRRKDAARDKGPQEGSQVARQPEGHGLVALGDAVLVVARIELGVDQTSRLLVEALQKEAKGRGIMGIMGSRKRIEA